MPKTCVALLIVLLAFACSQELPKSLEQEYTVLFTRITEAETPDAVERMAGEIELFRTRWTKELGQDDPRLNTRLEILDLLIMVRRDMLTARGIMETDPARARELVGRADLNLKKIQDLVQSIKPAQ